MVKKVVTKKTKKGKANGKAQQKLKKEFAQNSKVDKVPETTSDISEDEDEEDIIYILMKKCKMSEDEVIAANQAFLENFPGGGMSKEDFLLENEVSFRWVCRLRQYFKNAMVFRIHCWPKQYSRCLTLTATTPWTSQSIFKLSKL